MSSRSGYQPIAQPFDEVDHEADVEEGNQASSSQPLTTTRGSLRRPVRPGSIDLTKLDNAFKR
jgi:hypothetical protein